MAAGQNSSDGTRPQKIERPAPGAGEDVVEREHRHVAANAVAMARDRLEDANHGFARRRIEVVQLRDVPPRRKVRVATAGDEVDRIAELDRLKEVGRLPIVVERAFDVELGAAANPVVVEAGVIGDEVEDEPMRRRRNSSLAASRPAKPPMRSSGS